MWVFSLSSSWVWSSREHDKNLFSSLELEKMKPMQFQWKPWNSTYRHYFKKKKKEIFLNREKIPGFPVWRPRKMPIFFVFSYTIPEFPDSRERRKPLSFFFSRRREQQLLTTMNKKNPFLNLKYRFWGIVYYHSLSLTDFEVFANVINFTYFY